MPSRTGAALATGARAWLAQAALADVPKLLTLQDRNPHSSTYGCFDRNYWHYRIVDFPSGMAQEFVIPLALAHALPLTGSRYAGNAELRRLAVAGMRFAASSRHADGSCDDYYPFERASGATVFSLLACMDAYVLLGLEDEELLRFFHRRATWLAGHFESGRLSNHEALIALALEIAANLVPPDPALRAASQHRLTRLLDWQSPEGWFPEYDGLDPGYHTLTVSALARLFELRPHERLERALRSAVDLSAELVHPDGSWGGEHGSRNTYAFFPHGFELVGRWYPTALSVNDRVLAGLAAGRAGCFSDDHILGHHLWNYLLAWRDYVTERPGSEPPARGRTWLPQARLLIDRRGGTELFVSLAKGGSFKLFRDGRLLLSDTQASAVIGKGGAVRNAVGHLVADYHHEVGADEIVISGTLGTAKQARMTPSRMIVLRLLMMTAGRFFPNLVRRRLQSLLIVGKRDAPLTFQRTLRWIEDAWELTDELGCADWGQVRSLGFGPDQTSIYIAMSRTYQDCQLQPWLDVTDRLPALGPGAPLVVRRRLG